MMGGGGEGGMAGACDNSCEFANDGACDDGRPGAPFDVCAPGTDGNDCGDPGCEGGAGGAGGMMGGGGEGGMGNPDDCDDSCEFANDGACDDGRPGAPFDVCAPGTDDTDCGEAACEGGMGGAGGMGGMGGAGGDEPLDPLCNDSCRFANDDVCDDGRPGAAFDACEPGTDCGDCGPLDAEDPCALVLCPVGQLCNPETGACEADEPVDLCAAVLCGPGAVCNPATGACDAVEPFEPGPGAACAGDDTCPMGACITEAESDGAFTDGFCAVGCLGNDDCGDNGECVRVDADDNAICFERCGDAVGCRAGYVCNELGDDVSVCAPDCRIAGCGPAGGCNEDTGICEAVDGDGLGLGVACNINDDLCSRGLVCVAEDEDGNGTCRTLCDANGAPSGCGARELCLPFETGVPANQQSPGFCFAGDDCEPADRATCPADANGSCAAFPPISLCLPAGEAALGEACGFDADAGEQLCAAGLVCEYGRCKSLCEDGACGEGEQCIDYAERLVGLDYAFCHGGCDFFAQQGCGEGELCGFIDFDQNAEAVGDCFAVEDGDGTHGEACTPDEDIYFGDCDAAHVCGALTEGRDAICNGLCDVSDQSACAGASACAFGVVGDTLGLCVGECDALGDGAECGDGQGCIFTGLAGLTGGGTRAIGLCLPSAGDIGTGMPCELRDDASHDCGAGHVCAATEASPEQAVCVRLCQDDDACGEGEACAAGIFAGAAPDGTGTEAFGACLPAAN
jgi:hypothetical protein